METKAPPLVICRYCDAVHRREVLARGEVARCMRCHAVLYRYPWLSVKNLFALSVTAIIVLAIANAWPIVSLGLNGAERSATLWQAIFSIWHDGAPIVAVLTALMLFFFPLMQVMLFGWVFGFVQARRTPPGFVPVMRVLAAIRPWSLIEVFMLGTLVALVKIGSLFDVILQPGIWAFAVLTLLIALLTLTDLRRIWTLREERCQ